MIRTLPPSVTHHPTPTQAVADRKLKAVANALLAALARVRASFTLTAARQAVEDHHGVENLPDWSLIAGLAKAQAQPIEPLLAQIIIGGAQTEAQFAAVFDLVNDRAVQAARRQVADLVVGITEESLAALRGILSASLAGGYTPAKAARLIRDVVGLNPARADAVVNYRRSLERVAAGDSPASEAYRALADGRYSAAKGLTPAKIDTMVTRYAEKHLADRAMLIARTETIRAASLGQRSVWDEAANRGLIDRNSRIVWVTTDDDRTCSECAELDGATISMEGGSFTSGNFTSENPPLHPACRCTQSLDTDSTGMPEQTELLPEPSRPIEWSRLSGADAVEQDIDRQVLNGTDPVKARRVAEMLAGRSEVWKATDGTIVDFSVKARVSEAAKREVMEAVADLRTTYPHKDVMVKVADNALSQALTRGKATYGMTVTGGRTIILDPSAVRPAGAAKFAESVKAGRFMRAGGETSHTRYVVTHEFGHTLDSKARSIEVQNALKRHPAGSLYGRTNADEAVAESFAEWHISGGKTTDALAKELARLLGW